MNIRLFPEQAAQMPMRDILGMNNTPAIHTLDNCIFEKPYFEALNLGHIRFHDVPLENPAQMIIDIHRIFPFFHLDETDSRSYHFSQTDDYLRVIADSRAEIDFKLGETIDHSCNGRLIAPPEDPDKWARICRHIIGHYKNGEMDGMHLNITRVSVWEEPDNVRLFGGSVEQYAEMFCKVYKLLKQDFPDLKIGGPTSCCGTNDYIRKFLTICKENAVVPDYVSTTMYLRDIPLTLKVLQSYRELLNSLGFHDTPCSFSEWHMGPVEWGEKLTSVYENGFYTAHNAAFTASALITFMDVPYLDTVYYYAWGISCWAVWDRYSTSGRRMLPVYYGLLLYQKAVTQCTRIAMEAELQDGMYTLAGKTADGKTRLLIACCDAQPGAFTCTVPAAASCTLYSVNDTTREEDAMTGTQLPVENGTAEFRTDGKYGVYLLEFV